MDIKIEFNSKDLEHFEGAKLSIVLFYFRRFL